MSKAEERAWEKYPKKIEWVGNQWDGAPFDVNSESRVAYKHGYLQAEKDLELDWGDVARLHCLLHKVEQEFKKGMHEDKTYKGYCQEVLKQFKEMKK